MPSFNKLIVDTMAFYDEPDMNHEQEDDGFNDGDVFEFPIEDVLDLHLFQPKEVPDLLDDYFSACIEKGIYSLRIIHGKGKGILKKRVEQILRTHRSVMQYTCAPPEAGGWGAVIVELKKPEKQK